MKIKKTKLQIQQATTLLNDFKNENLQKRINAAKNIRFIGEVLGSQRIKTQLIPYLKEQVIYDEAPLVYQLFCNIQVLGDIMGGGLSYAFIFPLLEDGLQYQEQKVRKKVVQKYVEIIDICDLPKCQNQIMQSLKKLYNNDYDEVKQAFCCVVARKLGNFSQPNQQELIENYITLAQSSSIIKRKYAAKYSKQLIKWISLIESKILKIIDLISKDKDETNKLFLIDTIIELSKFKAPSALQSYFNMISYQFTWRIRYQLISKLEKLAAAIGKQNFKTFLTYYTKYINDIQPEIRSIANRKLQEVLPFIQVEDIINRILPAIKNIHTDQCSYVRNSLAHSLLHFCPIIGKNRTVQFILPKFLNILQVEQEQQVKQTLFKKVPIICQTVGIQTLSQSVVPVLQQMILNQNWRVRLQSINILLYLIKSSPLPFLNEKIIKFIIDYLKDKANFIRKESIKLIVLCIDQHGQLWVQKNIMIKLLPMFKSPTFLQRQSIVYAIQILAPKFTQDYLSKTIYSNLAQLVQDPVENVRINICATLGVLYNYLPKQKQAIKKLLKTLKEDKDNDVKQMASSVFSKLN